MKRWALLMLVASCGGKEPQTFQCGGQTCDYTCKLDRCTEQRYAACRRTSEGQVRCYVSKEQCGQPDCHLYAPEDPVLLAR